MKKHILTLDNNEVASYKDGVMRAYYATGELRATIELSKFDTVATIREYDKLGVLFGERVIECCEQVLMPSIAVCQDGTSLELLR